MRLKTIVTSSVLTGSATMSLVLCLSHSVYAAVADRRADGRP
jgi:hypothetical protein